jgi:hypothetical protein
MQQLKGETTDAQYYERVCKEDSRIEFLWTLSLDYFSVPCPRQRNEEATLLTREASRSYVCYSTTVRRRRK